MCTRLTNRPAVRRLLPGWTQPRESISGKARGSVCAISIACILIDVKNETVTQRWRRRLHSGLVLCGADVGLGTAPLSLCIITGACRARKRGPKPLH